MKDILIVDDEKDIRCLVAGILEDEGYIARVAGDSDTAFSEIERTMPSLVVLDIWLQGSKLDGLEVLGALAERYPRLPVVIISGHGNVDTAVAAIRLGAYDYIEKPFKADKLLVVAQNAIEQARLQRENDDLWRRAGMSFALIGRTQSAAKLDAEVEKLAQTQSRVMLAGPQGVDKETIARQIHVRSARCKGSFVAVHGLVVGDDVGKIERQLLGTQTDGSIEIGLFEEAQGGTLFLDEISAFPRPIQNLILKILNEESITRLGGTQSSKIDVRVLSSSSIDPQKAIAENNLCVDLYHRLSVVEIEVPGLSARREDIPHLVDYFVAAFSDQLNIVPRNMEHEVMVVLQSYAWPGNMRQLRNCIEHMLLESITQNTDCLTMTCLPREILTDTDINDIAIAPDHVMTLPLRDARERFEREYLSAQVERFSGNISRTAAFIGMERSALHRKLKSLGVLSDIHAKTP